MQHHRSKEDACPVETPGASPDEIHAGTRQKICELVACGWLMKAAARHYGVPPETVGRWTVRYGAFRAAYEVARAQRTEIWSEEIIEIADRRADYTDCC